MFGRLELDLPRRKSSGYADELRAKTLASGVTLNGQAVIGVGRAAKRASSAFMAAIRYAGHRRHVFGDRVPK